MIIEKESCWSILRINTFNMDLDNISINKIEKKLKEFEDKYSRFYKNNYLYKLNKSWKSSIDDEFKALFRVSKKLNQITNWFFDITILPFLENFWYGLEKEKLKQNHWMENIELFEDFVRLKNDVKIDFWAIWKWYMVDFIYQILIKRMENFTIDFWWDIKIWNQTEKVWLEDPFDDNKLIWYIMVTNESIWSSNWNKRSFNGKHHLVNPFSNDSQNDKIAVYVKHKSATLADWFSTSLFISPLELSLKILENTDWLEWLIISKDWKIYKSRWFDCELY